MEALRTKLIEKELVPSLSFPSDPIIIRSEQEQKDLIRKLNLATILGNVYHNKIKIIFQDNEGIKEVRTTVWATGDTHILLKRDMFIPINRILDIVI